MTVSNSQLLRILARKGLITTDDIGSAGKLNPVQADRFIDFVIDVTGLKDMSRIVRFRNEQMDIDKIGVGRRVTVPKREAQDPGVRRGVQHSKVTLQPQELMTPWELGDNYMENNIEGESVEDKIVRMMATQTGNDIEELAINGDILGQASLESDIYEGGDSSRYIKDSFLALINGWLRKADSGNLVNINGASISANVFSRMLNAMPIKFRKDRRRLRFLMSPDLEQLWRERLSTRATGMGDRALTEEGNVKIFGVEIVPVNLMPFNPTIVEHILSSGATGTMSLRYNNIVEGSVVVTLTTLDQVPSDPLVEDTDYSVDYTNGTISNIAGGAWGDTATVKVTYQCGPQILLTHMDNLITAIGREIRIERDRDIFAGLNQWAISTKVDFQFEEVTAIVKAYNVASSL